MVTFFALDLEDIQHIYSYRKYLEKYCCCFFVSRRGFVSPQPNSLNHKISCIICCNQHKHIYKLSHTARTGSRFFIHKLGDTLLLLLIPTVFSLGFIEIYVVIFKKMNVVSESSSLSISVNHFVLLNHEYCCY